jgi:hypothetical protein
MTGALRTVISRIGQARRLIVRAELTLTALQAAFWVGVATVAMGAVLLLRRRSTSSPRLTAFNAPGTAASSAPPAH